MFLKAVSEKSVHANNVKRAMAARIILVLAAVFFSCCLGGCSQVQEEPGPVVRPVSVVELQEETWPRVYTYTGTVSPEETVHPGFQISGRVKAVYVEKEDRVTADTLLAEIDDSDYQTILNAARSQWNAAQAQLDRGLAGASMEEIRLGELQVKKAQEAADQAFLQLERMVKLLDAGAVSILDKELAELEAVMAQVALEQAEEQLKQLEKGARPEEIASLEALRDAAREEYLHAERQAERTRLQTSGEGIVEAIHFRRDEMYPGGVPFVTLRTDQFQIIVSAGNREIESLQLGARAMVTKGTESVEAIVTNVSRTPDPVTGTYPVEIRLPEEASLVSGTVATVHIEAGIEEGIRVPMGALLWDQQDMVFVVEDGRAFRKQVTIEGVEGTMLHVTGLNPGTRLVVEGMHRLTDGENVVVKKGDES